MSLTIYIAGEQLLVLLLSPTGMDWWPVLLVIFVVWFVPVFTWLLETLDTLSEILRCSCIFYFSMLSFLFWRVGDPRPALWRTRSTGFAEIAFSLLLFLYTMFFYIIGNSSVITFSPNFSSTSAILSYSFLSISLITFWRRVWSVFCCCFWYSAMLENVFERLPAAFLPP